MSDGKTFTYSGEMSQPATPIPAWAMKAAKSIDIHLECMDDCVCRLDIERLLVQTRVNALLEAARTLSATLSSKSYVQRADASDAILALIDKEPS